MVELLPAREIAIIVYDFEFRWYGILYVLAFIVAWRLLPRLAKYRQINITKEDWLYVLTWGVAGVLFGGRLGHVLLYEAGFFLEDPAKIVALWQGGMSSHGGIIGVGLAMWWVSRRLKISFLALLDIVVIPAALGLALGRIGNVINQEIFVLTNVGILTSFKDIFIAGVCYSFLRNTKYIDKGGMVTAIFLILYSILRWISEYGRLQPYDGWLGISRGQIYTIPVFLLGIGLWMWVRNKSLRQQEEPSASSMSSTS